MTCKNRLTQVQCYGWFVIVAMFFHLLVGAALSSTGADGEQRPPGETVMPPKQSKSHPGPPSHRQLPDYLTVLPETNRQGHTSTDIHTHTDVCTHLYTNACVYMQKHTPALHRFISTISNLSVTLYRPPADLTSYPLQGVIALVWFDRDNRSYGPRICSTQ